MPSSVSIFYKKMPCIKMDHPHMVIAAAAAFCMHQLLAAYMVIFDDVPTASEARVAKSHKCKLTPFKRNLSVTYAWLTTNLEHASHLECILKILISLKWRMSLTFMGDSFSFLLTTSRI
jgi:hypothetical protein